MAITSIAPRSSMIAIATRSTFKPIGTPLPTSAMIPIAKAISVAEGIAHPLYISLSPPCAATKATYMRAGTSIPLAAAKKGIMACSLRESSPATSSRFISSPTRKKKTAINPSLMKCWSVFFKPIAPMLRLTGRCRKCW